MAVKGSLRRGNRERPEEPAEDDSMEALEGDLDADVDDFDDDVDDADTVADSLANPATKSRRKLPLVLVGVAALAVLVAAVVVAAHAASSTSAAKKAEQSTGLKTFVDKQAGFEFSYPASWKVIPKPASTTALQVSFGAGIVDRLVVQAVHMQASVEPKTENDIKTFTDGAIGGGHITVLQQLAITTNGLLGYNYLYTLPPIGKVKLVHSQFFIFPPHEMVVLLFQAVDTDFSARAEGIRQVLASFRAIPTS
jgi:hypothetical protein